MKFKRFYIFMFLLGIFLGGSFILLINNAFAIEQYGAMTIYKMSTDEDITIAWDDTNPDTIDYFEFYMWNSGEEQKYLIGKTQQLQITIKLPKTGLWVFYIRSCDKPDTDDTRECSEYAQSDLLEYTKVKDPVTGQFVSGKWMIYGHVAGPSEGGVVTTP